MQSPTGGSPDDGACCSAALALAGLCSVILAAHAAVAIDLYDVAGFVLASLIAGVCYLAAVGMVLKRPPRRHDFALIVIVAIILRGLALTPSPNLSTDAYRYVWDGRIQAAGYNPYLYVPADPRLAPLRDEAIYPNINQKERAVTIYPPAAELLFLAAHHIGDGLAAIRLVMTLLDAATIVVLLLLLRALSLPREHIVIYAWHPLPIWEFVCQGHVDAAVTTSLALAVLLTVRQRQGLAGVLLGIAALIKYFPVVLVPALWRRWDWRMPLAFVATAVVLYLPYIREAGGRVLGFLGNHLDNEGYAAGWGFHPIWLLRDFSIADPPAKAYVVVAIGLLALLGALVLFRRGASEVQLAALPLLGAAFVWLVSPHYPWYFAFLPALLVASPSAPVLLMSVLAVALYWPRQPGGITWTEIYLLVYWLPLALLAATAGWRLMRRA